ncbi:MAG: hypothetical protein DCF22_19670 [Leptolyngbya sp.]|nr:MAG: hypothetical protein DCF22_19670 [Leptolyngbya sp.]
MEEWKFLVQKDGDRSWLPLDSPDVEILEGRYRIVARFAQANTEVHIRICHLAIAEDPPKRRLQKRFSQTNANGLMVVVPYTYLHPGIWEFSCFSPDLMSDLMGDTLHHSVRLQVFASVAESDEDWDGDDSDDSTCEQIESASAPELQVSLVENGQIENGESANGETANHELFTPDTPTTPEIAALNVEIAQALGLSMDRLVTMTEQLSHQLIEEVFREFGVVSNASHFEPASATREAVAELIEGEQNLEPPLPTTLSEVDARAVQIILEREVFQASVGQRVAVVGRLMLQDGWQVPAIAPPTDHNLEQAESNDEQFDLDTSIAASTRWTAQELRISLRDPQTSEVVLSDRQSVLNEPLPHGFSFTLALPRHLTTHLLIGEVEVWGASSEQAEPIALQAATVTVTVNPDELMAEFQRVRTALDQEPDGSDLSDLAVEFSERLHRSKAKPVLDLSFLDLAATNLVVDQDLSSTEATSSIIPAKPKRSGLPPQLSEPQPDLTGTKRKLDLPAFIVTTRTSATAVQDAIAQEAIVEELGEQDKSAECESQGAEYAVRSAEESEMLDAETMRETLATLSTVTPTGIAVGQLTEKQQDGDIDSEVLALIEQVATDAANVAATPTVAEKPSPIKSAFQALRLEDRFFDRLSVLATDAELLVALKESVPSESAAEMHSTAEAPTESPAADWVTHEVVVDDDPMWQEWMRRSLSRAKRGEALELPFANPLVMPEDEAIPVPVIEILTDEIVAGRPMNLRLKLPNLLPKIYIKLWVNDRQTRSLLDGPRWMVDFFPNGHDELEAVTQLTVPFGTLAIRLEAIAVEVQTQRESQKISLDCEVIPPDFPELPIEDFNF